jgi:hypothetical protein
MGLVTNLTVFAFAAYIVMVVVQLRQFWVLPECTQEPCLYPAAGPDETFSLQVRCFSTHLPCTHLQQVAISSSKKKPTGLAATDFILDTKVLLLETKSR